MSASKEPKRITSGFCNPQHDAASHARCRMPDCACACHATFEIREGAAGEGNGVVAGTIHASQLTGNVVVAPLPLLDAEPPAPAPTPPGPTFTWTDTGARPDWPGTIRGWQESHIGLTDEDRAHLERHRGPLLAELCQAIAEGRVIAARADPDPFQLGRADAFADVIRWVMYGVPKAPDEA